MVATGCPWPEPSGPATAARPGQCAFTLIELLIVMTVIVILSSLILTAVGVVRSAITKAKTQSGVAIAQQSLSSRAAEGLPVDTVPHPLAATAAHDRLGVAVRRAVFIRAGGASDGSDHQRTGEALRVDDLTWLSSDSERTIADDDRYAGHEAAGDVPPYFGLRRDQLQILNAACETWAEYRQLPERVGVYVDPGDADKLRSPYDATIYPDERYLRSARLEGRQSLESLSSLLFRTAFGDQLDHLSDLGLILESPAVDGSDRANWITVTETITLSGATSAWQRPIDVIAPPTGTYDPAHRVWWPSTDRASAWRPRTHRLADGWQPYQQRGLSLIDSYQGELLCRRVGDNTYLISSPGLDGHFLLAPGGNGVYDTDLSAFDALDPSTIGGDDRPMSEDNINSVLAD